MSSGDVARPSAVWAATMSNTARRVARLASVVRRRPPETMLTVTPKLREDRADAGAANEVWAMDFVHDQLATGRKLRVLTEVDTWSRFSPAVDRRFSYRGQDVVQRLKMSAAVSAIPR